MAASPSRPGPKPVQYIPKPFRAVPGVEQITTVRQFQRLGEYLNTPPERRPAYVRLGASVPSYHAGNQRKPTATYAVCVDGDVSIIRLQRDPRAAERWMSNKRRDWHMARAFSAGRTS